MPDAIPVPERIETIREFNRFYTNVIGWGVRDASALGATYMLFTAGDAVVSGVMNLPESARNAGGRPYWVGYVEVKDVVTTAGEVRRLGGTVYVPPTGGGASVNGLLSLEPWLRNHGSSCWMNR